MRGNERRARHDVRAATLLEGGRWVAGAGFAYVAAWLVGLAIGLATSSPASTRALFDLNGEGDTYKLLALGVFIGATALLTLRSGALPQWLGWVGVVLAPLLVMAGWNFALSASAQLAAYTVLLLILLVWVAAIGVTSLRRAA